VASPRIRDLELVQMVADLLLALDGKPQGGVDITESFRVEVQTRR
jgi:transcription-repair coupling factor (superfamily II helicase)